MRELTLPELPRATYGGEDAPPLARPRNERMAADLETTARRSTTNRYTARINRLLHDGETQVITRCRRKRLSLRLCVRLSLLHALNGPVREPIGLNETSLQKRTELVHKFGNGNRW